MPRPTHATARRVKPPVPAAVDVAIIGCGPGGLAAGAVLARAGLSVALFDAHYVAGGSMTQFARTRQGRTFQFDVGLHYIGECGPGAKLSRFLDSLGLDVSFAQLDPEGFDELVFPEVRFRVPSDIELYRERLVALFPDEERGIDRWLRLVREVGTLARHPAGKPSLALALDALLRGRLAVRQLKHTIAEFLDGCTRDPTLRAIILGQHGDYALPPSQVSALMHAGLAQHYFGGAYYPRGGGQVISDQLAQAIENAGGTLHLRHPVRAVLTDGDGRAVGLRYADKHGAEGEIRARSVLSNADLVQTLTELVPAEHLPRSWQRRLPSFQMAPGQFLDKRPGFRGPLPGMYLCGASTRAGHGIVSALMSGRSAASCVLADRH